MLVEPPRHHLAEDRDMTTTTVTFETTECTRCGGCGHYSFNQLDGTRCFKCHGKGIQLSRRGAAARKAYNEAYDAATPVVLAADIKAGMRLFQPGTVTRLTATADAEPDRFNLNRVMVRSARADYVFDASSELHVRTTQAHEAGAERVRKMSGATIG